MIVLGDPNGQATTHMKDFVAELQRKGKPAKGWVADLDNNEEVVRTLGKWAKIASGLTFDPKNGKPTLPHNVLYDDTENERAQEDVSFSKMMKGIFTSPEAKKFYHKLMYGSEEGKAKPVQKNGV